MSCVAFSLWLWWCNSSLDWHTGDISDRQQIDTRFNPHQNRIRILEEEQNKTKNSTQKSAREKKNDEDKMLIEITMLRNFIKPPNVICVDCWSNDRNLTIDFKRGTEKKFYFAIITCIGLNNTVQLRRKYIHNRCSLI